MIDTNETCIDYVFILDQADMTDTDVYIDKVVRVSFLISISFLSDIYAQF